MTIPPNPFEPTPQDPGQGVPSAEGVPGDVPPPPAPNVPDEVPPLPPSSSVPDEVPTPATPSSAGDFPPPPPIPPAGAQVPPAAGFPAYQPAAGAAAVQYDVGAAFSFGWNKFMANAGAILAALALYFVVLIVASIVLVGISLIGARNGGVLNAIFGAVAIVGLVVVVFWVQAAVARFALALTDGKPAPLSAIASTDNLGNVIATGLIVGLVSAVASLICLGIPILSLIVGFFTQFVVYYVVDKNAAPIESIKSSIALVQANIVPALLYAVTSYVAYLVGVLLCGIGLLVAVPVIVIAGAYTYRVLNREPVAP